MKTVKMYINKESLGKILKTLQEKYDEMSDLDKLDFSSISLIKKEDFKKEFDYNKNYYLNKTYDEYEMLEIFKFMKNHKKFFNHHWEHDFASSHHLHIRSGSDEYIGYNDIDPNYELLSFEDFEKYIVNKDED